MAGGMSVSGFGVEVPILESLPVSLCCFVLRSWLVFVSKVYFSGTL